MKKTALVLILIFASWNLATAQTVTDNFSTTTNWTTGHSSFGTIAISGGVAGYTTTQDDNEASLMLTATTFSYTSDWEAQVEVHASLAGSLTAPDGYFYGSLMATPTGSIIGFAEPPATSYFSADMVRNNADENIFQHTWWQAGSGEGEGGFTGNIATTDAALRITFNSTNKVLEAFYDADGAVGGHNWLSAGSIDIDDPLGGNNWGLNPGNTISLGLVVFAYYGATPSEVYFDNFSATAIPEPSTYAALFGLLALGLAGWHRRRAKVG